MGCCSDAFDYLLAEGAICIFKETGEIPEKNGLYLMDVNAGKILAGESDLEDIGFKIIFIIMNTCSVKPTKSEA